MNACSALPFRRAPRAFTLIELLTVIAIIGILAAIIIPTIGKVRSSAKSARCASTIREWGRAVMLYANDNKGGYTTRGVMSDGSPGSRGWQDAGQNPYTRYMTSATSVTSSSQELRGCAMNPVEKQADYALSRGSINGNIETRAHHDRIPLSQAKNPSQLLLMIDGVMIDSAATSYRFYISSEIERISTHVMPMFDSSLATPSYVDSAKRHGGKSVNAVFADGSVKRVTDTPAGQGDRNSILEMREIWFQIY